MSCLLFLLLIRHYLALTLKILIFAFSYLFLRLDSLNTHKAGLFYPLDLATALRLLILSYCSRADIFVIEGTRMLGQKKNVCFWSNGLYNFGSSASNKNKSTNSFLCIIANKILWWPSPLNYFPLTFFEENKTKAICRDDWLTRNIHFYWPCSCLRCVDGHTNWCGNHGIFCVLVDKLWFLLNVGSQAFTFIYLWFKLNNTFRVLWIYFLSVHWRVGDGCCKVVDVL